MPIITPAYPSMCATHNVTQSTQTIVREEFKKGEMKPNACFSDSFATNRTASDIIDKVIVNKASWSDLFSKHDFFHKYRHYLQAIASTGSPELQIKWYDSIISVPG